MTLQEAQARVDAYIKSTGKGYFPELANLARLTEEVGELARIYVRRQYLKPKDTDATGDSALEQEMGDALFVLICLANQSRIQLDRALLLALEKYQKRDAGRHD